jgi:hypothetical protein
MPVQRRRMRPFIELSIRRRGAYSLGDVKDAGLVKGGVASKLNELIAATERSIGEVVVEVEWVSGCWY